VRASAALHARGRPGALSRLLLAAILPFTTAVGLLGLSLLILLQPLYVHTALDAAGAPEILGVSRAEAHSLSDQTVDELLFGPGTFRFAGTSGEPFYDPAEAAHLRDVRLVLYGFLGLALLGAVFTGGAVARGWRDRLVWRAIGRGGAGLAVGLIGAGLLALVAFDLVFELFHRIFFPGGNWAFDPATQRLVQLYPLAFWQLTAAAIGLLGIIGGLAVWAVARLRARRLEAVE
jgi:integral membrane protein (TIGR01906 family)